LFYDLKLLVGNILFEGLELYIILLNLYEPVGFHRYFSFLKQSVGWDTDNVGTFAQRSFSPISIALVGWLPVVASIDGNQIQ
jgi:hypothetical protein